MFTLAKRQQLGNYIITFQVKEGDYAETYRVKDADGKIAFSNSSTVPNSTVPNLMQMATYWKYRLRNH